MDDGAVRTSNQASMNKIEPLVLFLLGGLFIYLGQAIFPAYPEAERWVFWIYTLIGMSSVFLAAHAFGRSNLMPWFAKPLASISRWLGVRPFQVLLIVAAPFISFAAWLAAGDGGKMLMPAIAVSAWLFAIGSLISGHWPLQKETPHTSWSSKDAFIAIGLFCAALCLRGISLGRIPWVLTGDEGSSGLAAVQFIDGTRDNIFGLGWFSFPSLFFLIQSIPIRIMGQTAAALRTSSMIAGALTIPALYWYTNRVYGRYIAILSSAFLTVFHFHIHFSRLGLNNIWDGLFFVLFSGIFFHAWSKERSATGTLSFVGAGLILGIGQYFYSSVRVLLAMLLLWLTFAAMRDWRKFRMKLAYILSTSIGFLVAVLPLASFYIKHPQEFAAPFRRVSILGPWLEKEMLLTGDPAWVIMASQFRKAALAFTHINLRSWYNPDHPMLLVLPSVLFLIGIVLLLMKLFRPKYTWIGIWLLSAIGIAALSESTPAAQRLTFVAPAVAIVVAIPIEISMRAFSAAFPRKARFSAIAAIVLIIAVIAGEIHFYFAEYSGNRKFSDINTETADAVAYYLRELEPEPTVHFFGPPRMGFFSHSNLPYLAPNAIGFDVREPLQEPAEFTLGNPTIFIFIPERSQELDFVRQVYPQGKIIEQYGRDDLLLYIAYQVDG